MFTDKFIKLPIKTIDRKMSDMGLDAESEDDIMPVNPEHIITYRATTDVDDEDDAPITAITLSNGEVVLIYLPIDEFEKQINRHWQRINDVISKL